MNRMECNAARIPVLQQEEGRPSLPLPGDDLKAHITPTSTEGIRLYQLDFA